MEYKLRQGYLDNPRMVRRFDMLIKAYTDKDGKINLPDMLKNKELSDTEALRIFDVTKADLAHIRHPKPNSFVWDVRQGWGFEFIECPVGPIKFFDGRPFHACARLGDGSLVPIERSKTLDTTPEKLYRAINWKAETNVLFSMKQALLEKLQIGGIAVIIVIMLFFAFVLVNS